MAAILDNGTQRCLAILNLYVAPMAPTTYNSGGDVENVNSY